MKKTTQLVFSLVFLLLLCLPATAQTNWSGDYYFSEEGGKTVGGANIYILHSLLVRKSGEGKITVYLHSQGFQTSIDLHGTGETEDSKLMFRFDKTGKDHVLGEYEKGDLLLTLEQTAGGVEIKTHWGEFLPIIDANKTSGKVRFEREADSKIPWMRIQTDNGEVSLEVPIKYNYISSRKGGFIVAKNRESHIVTSPQMISSFSKKTLLSLESYKTQFPLKVGRIMRDSEKGKKTKFKLRGYYVFRLKQSTKDHFTVRQYIHTPKRLYILTASSRNGETPEMKLFFNSLIIKGQPAAKTAFRNAIKLSELNKLDITISLNSKAKKQPAKRKKNGGKKTASAPSHKRVPLTPVVKPRPSYTKSARQNNLTGRVMLKATFSRSGQITKIDVVKGRKGDLLSQSIWALIRARFLPPEYDGYTYSVTKRIEYRFSIY